MKYNYCAKCDKAFVKSRLEKDRCLACGGQAETVDVKRNGLYYLGYGIMIGGAVSALLPRFVMDLQGPELYRYLGIILVVAGMVAVIMGSLRMADSAKKLALEKDDGAQ